MRMETNSLSDEKKNPRYIMNRLTTKIQHTRIIMLSKTSEDSSLLHTKKSGKYHTLFIPQYPPQYRRKVIYRKLRANIETIM